MMKQAAPDDYVLATGETDIYIYINRIGQRICTDGISDCGNSAKLSISSAKQKKKSGLI